MHGHKRWLRSKVLILSLDVFPVACIKVAEAVVWISGRLA